jgi:tellurite resistance protein TerC
MAVPAAPLRAVRIVETTPLTVPTWLWTAFGLLVVALLALDLGVFHRRQHEIRSREAFTWVAFWISLALVFNLGVWLLLGAEAGLMFFTGYLIEYSLSVDNIFVFILVLSYFHVPPQYQHRVLFWGILGAIILRAVMILAGIALINAFHWIIYVFGAILIFSGIKMALSGPEKIEPEKNPVLRVVRRLIPISQKYDGARFLTRIDGRLMATPLLVVLIVIEFTDVVFALDSIPAILAISRDPFIVYTSNIFAILGLRSLYFALARMMAKFRFLSYGLAAILVFVGTKMALSEFIHIPIALSLSVIASLLTFAIVGSLLWPRRAATDERVAG